jgi:hypothetical protein
MNLSVAKRKMPIETERQFSFGLKSARSPQLHA